MHCDDLGTLLHGYVDGELDLMQSLEIEHHLEECPACAEAMRRQRTLKKAFADPGLYHVAPPALLGRVRASLRPARPPAPVAPPWRALALAASLAFLALLTWDVVRLYSHSVADPEAQQVVANHVRSLLATHLLDVTSSDQHTVKPWFNGRVDFGVPVKDFKDEGFPLEGGRLDVLANQNVAALVYRHNKHVINVFVSPAAAGGDTPPQGQTLQEYHLFRWTRGGMAFWVVSDLNEQELRKFVELWRQPGWPGRRTPADPSESSGRVAAPGTHHNGL